MPEGSKKLDRRGRILIGKISPLLLQQRPKICVRCLPEKEGKIVLRFWYPYNTQDYGKRNTVINDGARLASLSVSELNTLGEIITTIVGGNFEAELTSFKDGIAEFSLVPRK